MACNLIFLVLFLLILNTVALNSATTNIDGNTWEASSISKSFTENMILMTLSSNRTILTESNSNLLMSIASTTKSNNSTYELAKIQEKLFTTIRPNYYTSNTTYNASDSNGSLSGGAIAGIVIVVIILLCCCSVLSYKREKIWGFRRIA